MPAQATNSRITAWLCSGLLLLALLVAPKAQADCQNGACVFGHGPTVSLDLGQAELLGPLIEALLPGTNVDVSIIDFDGIAQLDVNLNLFLELLAAEVGVVEPDEALDAEVTLLQVLNVAIDALEADGNLVGANLLGTLIPIFNPLEGQTIALGDILVVDFPQGSLTDIDINVLELLLGSIQLFNFVNGQTSPQPVTINGDAPLLQLLGLDQIIGTTELFVQVVEPPSFGCRPEGATIRSPTIRIKLDLNLLDLGLDQPILQLLDGILGPLVDVTGNVSSGEIGLYLEVGGSEAVIAEVDPETPRVEIDVMPSVASIYLGQLDDNVFFDKGRGAIDPDTELDFAEVAAADFDLQLLSSPALTADLDLAIRVRTHGNANDPGETLVFTGPFPETQTSNAGASAFPKLLADLISNLELEVDLTSDVGPLETLLDAIGLGIDDVIPPVQTLLDTLIADAVLSGVVEPLVDALVDPLLDLLGIGIGQAEFTVLGAGRVCGVSGYVYLDENANALRSGGEGGIGQPLFAKLISADDPDTAVAVVPVDPTTGRYDFPFVFEGDYQIVIDDNDDPDDVLPGIPPGFIGTEAPDQTRSFTLGPGSAVGLQNFGLIAGSLVTGQVFEDTGSGGGVANDGQLNGGEAGIGDVRIVATDAAGNIVAETRTAGDGSYSLVLPDGVGEVTITQFNRIPYVSVGGDPGNTGGNYERATDSVTFTPIAGEHYSDVNFADVPANLLTPDNQGVVAPGETVVYSHRFVAGSAGEVELSATATTTPASNGWTQILRADPDCDGVVDPGEPLLVEAVDMAAGEALCVTVAVSAPEDAGANSQRRLTLTADFDYSNANPALGQRLQNTDLTLVSASTAGVRLVKTADRQQALPGETVTFTLEYRNDGDNAVSDLEISDVTPAYTTLLDASCGPLPAGITDCEVVSDAGGAVTWTLSGSLPPTASGAVTMQVRLND